MSLSGIFSSSLLQRLQGGQNNVQNQKSEFQKLGQDLQSGNLAQAQQDFATLTQNAPAGAQGNSTINQAFSALGQALQSGNLSAAQQDFAAIQQDLQQVVGQTQGHHHRRHGGGGSQQATSASQQGNRFPKPSARWSKTSSQEISLPHNKLMPLFSRISPLSPVAPTLRNSPTPPLT